MDITSFLRAGAVINTGRRQRVYVVKGEGYFEPREVVLGMKVDGMAEVIRGLREGERVASSATFLIVSESKLKVSVGDN